MPKRKEAAQERRMSHGMEVCCRPFAPDDEPLSLLPVRGRFFDGMIQLFLYLQNGKPALGLVYTLHQKGQIEFLIGFGKLFQIP